MELLVPQHTALTRPDDLEAFTALAHAQPFLERQEEERAVHDWFHHRDRASGELLVRAHLRLVLRIARKYRRQWPDTMDLVQEGNVGLLEALYRFDPQHGSRFATYAGFWVRATILRFLLDNWSLVRMGRSRAGRRLFFELQRQRNELAQMGIEPTAERIAERMGIDVDEVQQAAPLLDGGGVSLDRPTNEDGGDLHDILAVEQASPEAVAARRELQRLAAHHLDRFGQSLSGREAEIWRLRLVADEPMSLSELGDRFGISKQRVGQIERRMKDRLRRRIAQDLGGAVQVD